MSAFQEVVSRAGAKHVGSEWRAKCPAHDDDNPSLTIREGKDGNVLMKCHAGCETEKVVVELGLKMSDLFENSGLGPPNVLTPTARYEYRDESWELAFVVERRVDGVGAKRFVTKHPDKSGDLKPGLGGRQLLPYRLPEVLAADPSSLVFIVEGEKDVDRLRSFGLVSTTNPFGAGKWLDDFNIHLTGRDVVLVPDNDPPGLNHISKIGRPLTQVARSVKVLELPDLDSGGDVSDYFDAGHSVEEFRTAAAAAVPFDKWTLGRGELASPAEDDSSMMLTRLCDIRLTPIDWVWDGLVPAGCTTVLFGDGGVGKSLLALDLALHVATGSPFLDRDVITGPVVYVDAESLAWANRDRAGSLATGLGLSAIPEDIVYHADAISTAAARSHLRRLVEKATPVLTIIDSFTAAFPCLDPNDAGEIAEIFGFARDLGTVLLIDHVAKVNEYATNQKKPFGSAFKHNFARSVLRVSRAGCLVSLEQIKNNFAAVAEKIVLRFDFAGDEAGPILIQKVDGEANPIDRYGLIRAALKDGPLPAVEIAKRTGVPDGTIANGLTTLKKRGDVFNPRRGLWQLSDSSDSKAA